MELLVVGLDGLSYNMLEEFDVEAPFLREVRADGVSGPLRSVDAPTTLPAWTSFATGKEPGTHGITTMLEQDRSYDINPSRPNTDDAALYDFLDDAVVINLPGTVTREPGGDDVHLVSSFLATDASEAVPPALQSLDATADYVVQGDTSLQATPEAYMTHLVDVTDARFAFATEAFDRCDPRVGFVLFSTPDWVGHFLQHAPDAATAGRWYRRIVERADEYAAELAADADNVLLLSDHGFERKERAIHLQTWLRDEGYLAVDAADRSSTQRFVTGVARALAKTFRPGYELARDLYTRLDHATNGEAVGDLVDFNPDVSFAASTAWHLRYGFVTVNDDRFASPTVDDPAAVRRDLQRDLAGLTDDGRSVFSEVLLAEEAYENVGPTTPDVIARPAPGYLPLRAFSPTDSFVRTTPSDTFYDHRYDGLVAARGPLFAAEADVEASIVDVLPTLLHALGEAIPPDLDGQVRSELLATDEAPRSLAPEDVPEPTVRGDRGASTTTVEERLGNLGYLR